MALLARVKNWIDDEILTNEDLNAEFNNIINNFEPNSINDASPNATEFAKVFDPGNVGTENLPTTLNDELKSLRSMIAKITGQATWYIPPSNTLLSLAPTVQNTTPLNRVTSGFVDSDNQPMYLQANGADLFLQLEADPTPLNFVVNNQSFSKSVDDSVSVTSGPAANNTAVYNDAINTGPITKFLGEEEGSKILLTTVGSEFTSRINQWSAFAFVNGPNTEHFIGIYRDDGSQTFIENCFRGFFFNDSLVNQRVELAVSQSITILQLSWIFIKTDGTLTFNTSNNQPIVSGATPGSPASGDYWFDLAANIWKVHDGVSFVDATATLIGFSAQQSGACIATRSFDFFLGQSPLCDLALRKKSVSVVESNKPSGRVDVYGTIAEFNFENLSWDMAADLDSGVSESASTRFYMYLTDGFLPKISDVKPFDRQLDLKGYYHPAKPWRCIGYIDNDSGQDFGLAASTYGAAADISDHSISTLKLRPYSELDDLAQSGSAFNTLARLDVNLLDTATSASVGLKTSGRPVLLIFEPGNTGATNDGIRIDAGNATLNIQRRDLPGGSFTTIHESDLVLSAGTLVFPGGPVKIDPVKAGQYEYRIDTVLNSGTGSIVKGTLWILEL